MHALGPSGLRAALCHLPIRAPVAAVVLLGEVVRGRHPALNVYRVLIEALIAVGQKARPLTASPPALEDLGLHLASISVPADEPDLVRMGVPPMLAVR